MWAWRHEVRVQDGLDHRLEPRTLADDLHPPGDLAPQGFRACIRHPHLRQEATGVGMPARSRRSCRS